MNKYADRWERIHSNDSRFERKLTRLEVEHARAQPHIECGKCGQPAHYRPGVGAYQCVSCGALRRYDGGWVK